MDTELNSTIVALAQIGHELQIADCSERFMKHLAATVHVTGKQPTDMTVGELLEQVRKARTTYRSALETV
ncbi:MAG TPA: hypothetical protein DCZ12_12120 [Gammaproteobacteria bacterium]|nr:hypothetical protein [Gammaproteobacteria bacterium]